MAFLILGLAICGPSYGQNTPPNFKEIIDNFIEKAEKDSVFIGDQYTHEESETIEGFKDGVVVKKEEKLSFVKKQKGILFQKILSKDGVAVSRPRFEKKRTLDINAKLLKRYFFIFQGEEIIEGKECWVVSFNPKDNLPEPEKEDRTLNNSTGKIWFTKDTLILKKMEAKLMQEVDYGWGILGLSIKRIEYLANAIDIDGHHAMGYSRAEYEYSGRGIIKGGIPSKHEIRTVLYKDYNKKEDK